MKISKKAKRKVGLNLTSLIDVLFILIIFFAVSSTFLEQPGIELKLPEAKSGNTQIIDKVIINVDRDGNIYLNDKPVKLDALAEQVKTLNEKRDEKSVTLNADSDVKHGTVISIMDALRRDGIYKIVIATAKPPVGEKAGG
jgi:biopolymer transport protein ExbD